VFGVWENNGGHIPALDNNVKVPGYFPDYVIDYMTNGNYARQRSAHPVDLVRVEKGVDIFSIKVRLSFAVFDSHASSVGDARFGVVFSYANAIPQTSQRNSPVQIPRIDVGEPHPVRKKLRYRTLSGTGRSVNGNYHDAIIPSIEKNIKSTVLKNNDLKLDLGEFYAKSKKHDKDILFTMARQRCSPAIRHYLMGSRLLWRVLGKPSQSLLQYY
jgi:hypothetical protein